MFESGRFTDAPVRVGRDGASRAARHTFGTGWNLAEPCGVQFTDFDGGSGTVIEACAAVLNREVSVEMWPERPAGRGYYEPVCFKLSVIDDDERIEVADGGLVNWTQQLLENAASPAQGADPGRTVGGV